MSDRFPEDRYSACATSWFATKNWTPPKEVVSSSAIPELFTSNPALTSAPPSDSTTPDPKTLQNVKAFPPLLKNSLTAWPPNLFWSGLPNILINSLLDETVVGTKAGPLEATPITPAGVAVFLNNGLLITSISLSKKPGDLNVCSAIILIILINFIVLFILLVNYTINIQIFIY